MLEAGVGTVPAAGVGPGWTVARRAGAGLGNSGLPTGVGVGVTIVPGAVEAASTAGDSVPQSSDMLVTAKMRPAMLMLMPFCLRS